MTRFGFALDQRSCIGCHACTVARKQEHGVELGVFRTWVKYIEQGTFPDTRRYFSVLRCNHCDEAPCVSACPVTALYRREDGIVDFDPERCIGCKACLNACPYDALYIDPNSHTAAKCNFCAHPVDQGMKPSCEIVCPTQAIISGDLDDPDSEISRLIDTVPSRVRAPEQGTHPKVFYLGAQEAALDPLAVLLLVVGARGSALADVIPGGLALGGIALTGLFLVSDLKRPDRLLYLFLRPQWRSWLAIGTQTITLAALLAFAFLIASAAGADGVRDALRWAIVPAGIALAGYTAFLFNQCEGRDLWQSPLLLPHTIINAILAGAGALGIAALFTPAPNTDARALAWAMLLSASFGLAIIALDSFGAHPTRQAERAAHNLWRDRYAKRFWSGLILAGVVAALLAAGFLVFGGAVWLALAGVAALVGLWLYEDAWVRAGQSVPLS